MDSLIDFDILGRERQLDPDYLSLIEDMHVLLNRDWPGHVAVTPFGSRLKGYDMPDSDYDVFIIGGDSGLVAEQNRMNSAIKCMALDRGKKAHAYDSIDASYFEANFKSRNSQYVYSHALYLLAYPYIGNLAELQRLRRLAKERHENAITHDPQFAKQSVCEAASSLVIHELGMQPVLKGDRVQRYYKIGPDTAEKIVSRGFAPRGIEVLAETRYAFWKARLSRMLHEW